MKNNKKFISGRSLKYGSNAIILIVAVVAIAVLLNVFVGLFNLKVDLTPNKIYSLSESNAEFLESVRDRQIEIIGLFDDAQLPTQDYSAVKEILDNYRKYPNIKVSYVDPDKNPGAISQLDPNGTLSPSKGDFIVKCDTRIKKVTRAMLFYYDQTSSGVQYTYSVRAEESLSGAIQFVTAESTPTIYYLTGHGEKSVSENYTQLAYYLDVNNYAMKELNLSLEEDVPQDAVIVMLISPNRDITTAERLKLEKYLKERAGNMYIFFDSLESEETFENLSEVMRIFNIEINNDRVQEASGYHYPGNPYIILEPFQTNDINGQLASSNIAIIMPQSRSLNISKNAKEYLTTYSLIKTSAQAVGELITQEGQTIKGPLDLAIASESTGSGKMVVVGNSAFMEDYLRSSASAYFNYGLLFVINTVRWIAPQEKALSITPKVLSTQKFDVTQNQAMSIGLVVVVIIPLLILIAGFVIWLRRRHL